MTDSRRQPSSPPDLAGYSYVGLLGMGGYADVFLYEQLMPRRQVAVKVMVDVATTEADRVRFTAEANAMAQVADHPHIVSIYGASVSPDGRPFLVMELYDGENYSLRSRASRMAVPDALRIGVQVSCAVETAHRAGILHRDIKPANILTNRYGKAALTDFGIAGSSLGPETGESVGLSLPWAAPEVVMARSPGDERSDVYALAATIHSLLTGRGPFELPGAPLTMSEMMARIDRVPVPTTGREDTPASLERILAQAMAKSPEHRPRSAVSFARSLQEVEVELGYQTTPLDLYDAPSGTPGVRAVVDVDDEDSTRVKGARVIDPEGEFTDRRSGSFGVIDDVPVADPSGLRDCGSVAHQRSTGSPIGEAAPPPPNPSVGSTRTPISEVDWSEETRVRATSVDVDAPIAARTPRATAAIGAVVLLVVLGVAVFLLNRGDSAQSSRPPSTESPFGTGSTVDVSAPMAVKDLKVVAAGGGTYEATWSLEGDGTDMTASAEWYPSTRPSESTKIAAVPASTGSVTLSGVAAGDLPCVLITVSDADDNASPPTSECAQPTAAG